VLRFVDEAVERGADTVVLPELCVPGYVLDRRVYTPELLGECAAADRVLLERSAASRVRVVYGTAQERAGRLVNAVVLAEPDGRCTSYAKSHMVGKERALFQPGDEVVVRAGSSVALGCCYDLAFPEFSRAAATAGAGLLAFPMAWERERAFVLEAVATARAVENLSYVVCANQCGDVGGVSFHGRSRVVDPLGRVAVRMGEDPGLAVADVDLGLVARLRGRADTASYPLLDDRRIDLRVRVEPDLA
jgi:predicted amidohydrolase